MKAPSEVRTGPPLAEVVPVSTDEQKRLVQHSEPRKRFHYKYFAADLAWEAAELMPNESEQTARVLCEAGWWLADRDPKAADRFYKAMVRRCRSTPLGKQADQLRWFPRIPDGQPTDARPGGQDQ